MTGKHRIGYNTDDYLMWCHCDPSIKRTRDELTFHLLEVGRDEGYQTGYSTGYEIGFNEGYGDGSGYPLR